MSIIENTEDDAKQLLNEDANTLLIADLTDVTNLIESEKTTIDETKKIESDEESETDETEEVEEELVEEEEEEEIKEEPFEEQLRTILGFPVGKKILCPEIIQYVETSKPIYCGRFCWKQQGRLVENNKLVLIKIIRSINVNWPRELKTLYSLHEQHPNLTKLEYYSFAKVKPWVTLILETMNFNLRLEMREYKLKPIPSIVIKAYMHQLFRGIDYLHSFDICHRNIKPENILVDKETRLLKIGNFEQSDILHGAKQKNCVTEITPYQPPEILVCSPTNSVKADIWSIGCVIGELLNNNIRIINGDTPDNIYRSIRKLLGTPTRKQLEEMGFAEKNIIEISKKKVRNQTLTEIYSHWPEKHLTIMQDLLQYSPAERPDSLDILHHPFFSELRDPTITFPNGTIVPDYFKFTDRELEKQPDLEWISTRHT